MKTKYCSACEQEKPAGEFNKNRRNADGLNWCCRECERQAKRDKTAEDREIREKGLSKKCSECGKTKLLTYFYRDSRRSDGRQAQCKACRKKKYGDDSLYTWPTCKYCGDDLDPHEKGECCEICARKSSQWSGRGKVHLVVYDPSPRAPFKGGHFYTYEVNDMLKHGYWEEGTIFEVWMHNKYRYHCKVVGAQLEGPQELERVEGMEAKGDGRFLRIV
jgi:hypothetical protein